MLEEVIGRSLKDLSQDIIRGERHLEKLLAEGTQQEFEVVQLCADSTPIHLLINASIIEFKGRTAILSINRDITGRKRAEESARNTEERLATILEGSRDAILIEDDGMIVYVNQSSLQLLGYDQSEDLVGKHASVTLPPDEAERLAESGHRRRRDEMVPSIYQFKVKRKDGMLVEVEGAVSISIVSGKKYITTTMRDITERKRAEKALRESEEQLRQSQKLESVGQLAGGIAHDFNNLLVVINGYSDLMLRGVDQNHPLRSKIEAIKQAGGRAANLTRQLLAFSRKQILQPVVLDLNIVVTNIGKMLQRFIGEDIELSHSLKPALGRITADPGQLEQVIINLAVNARDAMPQGGRLSIETANIELSKEYACHQVVIPPGRYVRLTVSDTGVGMDKQTQEKIFEPFFTTKEVGRGTGLGLSTVYGIVKQSGGFICVHSEQGKGTTFNIYLPRTGEEAGVFEAKPTEAELTRGTETVLLVEDEAAVRLMTKEILEMAGYTVLDTANGSEALALCEQHEEHISLLLTDVVMPVMDGRELAERLNRLRPKMKVLYMSGYTDDAIVRHGVLNKGVAFLEKPFMPDTLARKVREVLDGLKDD